MINKINFEWRHLDLNSVTCSRCSETGKNIQEVIYELKIRFQNNLEISFTEIKLGKERIKESNLVLINGVEIEKILQDMTASENDCPSCCDLLEEQTCCRTLVEKDGTVHEEVSKELLLKAAIATLKIDDKKQNCCCSTEKSCCSSQQSSRLKTQLTILVFLFLTWIALYSYLPSISKFVAYTIFCLKEGTHLGASIEFFFLDVPKVLMLLALIVFFVGIIRSFFTPERTRKILAGKKESVGNVWAALLGIVTPFCSCSAVPLFIGFVSAGVPLGVTFSFLISAPMVNEIALVLLYGMFGWKIAALYFGTGLLIAMVAGWTIGRLKMERHIEDWVREMHINASDIPEQRLTWPERFAQGRTAVRDIVGRVWIFVVLGIAVGAGIHGYVPEGFMASIMGKGAWWSVPVAVLVGIPMYSNAAGIVPVVEALLGKGAALGTVLAFMMSVIALSLPEMVILRKVLKLRLIAVFIGVVGSGILFVGYLFNLII